MPCLEAICSHLILASGCYNVFFKNALILVSCNVPLGPCCPLLACLSDLVKREMPDTGRNNLQYYAQMKE